MGKKPPIKTGHKNYNKKKCFQQVSKINSITKRPCYFQNKNNNGLPLISTTPIPLSSTSSESSIILLINAL